MKYIEDNIDNMKEDLKKLVSYNSVNSDDAFPFGKNNQLVLAEAIKMMNRVGLKTTNLDNYCAYGEVGQGDKVIGVVCHLDIVPCGDGWDSDPFTMIEKDGVLYGRGVSDDKGAAIASLYALKYLIENNYKFNKRVRLLLGCNEETGSKCLAYYVKKEGHVDMGFTPDGEFPGIFAEKGMIHGLLIGKSKIVSIKGGDASNIVPKKVECTVNKDDFDLKSFKGYLDSKSIRYDIDESDKDVHITVFGKAAHASTPDLGINAISYLMEALFYSGIDDEYVNHYHNYLGLENHGETLGFERLNDNYTNTSINMGVISKSGDEVSCTLDMRFPVKSNIEDCKKLLEVLNDANIRFECVSSVEPLFFDLDNPMIKSLKKAYKKVTGDDSDMLAIGGGTYAKEMHNIIAFGCEFLGEDNHIHDANESLSIESFKKQVEIYIEAIKSLNEEC